MAEWGPFWKIAQRLLEVAGAVLYGVVERQAAPFLELTGRYLGEGMESDPLFWCVVALFALYIVAFVRLRHFADRCGAEAARLL